MTTYACAGCSRPVSCYEDVAGPVTCWTCWDKEHHPDAALVDEWAHGAAPPAGMWTGPDPWWVATSPVLAWGGGIGTVLILPLVGLVGWAVWLVLCLIWVLLVGRPVGQGRPDPDLRTK